MKPILYFYPPEPMDVSVVLGRPQNLTHTYPKYKDGWSVRANPDGSLICPITGRSYYALYWEGLNTVSAPDMTTGFVIKAEDTIPFLEEKLAVLGLSEREANEFIIYWLPKLESSPYTFYRFQTRDEINANMPLSITPVPDTIIRVMMEFKSLSAPISVEPQSLPLSPERVGFVVVEWGGTELSTGKSR